MSRRLWALLAIIGGAAVAAPLPVLEVTAQGGDDRTLALDLAGRFSYEYRQSIYEVPVFEDFRSDWGRLRLERVRSPSPAALEYFRWPTEVRRDTDSYVVDAPDVVEDELVIRIAPAAEQRLRIRPGHFLRLAGLGSDVVRVRAGWRPLIAWLPTLVLQLD